MSPYVAIAASTTLPLPSSTHVRLVHAACAVGHGVLVSRSGRRHADGQVDDAVAVLGDVRAEFRASAHGPAQHEPRVAGLEHVGRLVPAAGLRAAIGDAAHAEGGGVEVRGLPGVADGEDYGVHASHRESIGRCHLRHCLGCHCLLPVCTARADFHCSIRQGVMLRNGAVDWLDNLPQDELHRLTILYRLHRRSAGMIDELDGRLIELLAAEPRVGMLEASRRLGVARGTVQARLDRMHARGVITGYGPDIDPAAIGYRVTAFVTLELRQAGGHEPVAQRLGADC